MTFQACSGRIQLSCQVHGAGAGLRSDIPSCLGRGAAALSTFYLRQLGTQACPPPGRSAGVALQGPTSLNSV